MTSINNNKKIKIISFILLSIIVIILLVFFIIEFYRQWKFNEEIINVKTQIIELSNIKQLNLWNRTIESLKNNKKYIEIKHDNYSVKLITDELKSENLIDTNVEIKDTSYLNWKNRKALEIDFTNVENINIIDQIIINCNKYLKNLKRVDVYGIKSETKKCEFLETKELVEDELTIVSRSEYEKYILIYIPVENIITTTNEISMVKNDTYRLNISLYPSFATHKFIHIEDNEGDIVKINDDGTMEAVKPGEQEIIFEAEDGKVKASIKVIVKEIVEGIEVSENNIELTEGDSKEINAKVLPEDIENKNLLYESSNTKIIKVSKEGKIEAIKEGTANVIIKTEAEPIQEKQIQVKVKKKIVDNNIAVAEGESRNSNTVTVQNIQNPNQNSILVGNYINGILLVNKKYTLPSNYNPGTNQEALQAFKNMQSTARREGIQLNIVSGFRSYQTQEATYQRNVSLYGEEVANSFSAKPRTIRTSNRISFRY